MIELVKRAKDLSVIKVLILAVALVAYAIFANLKVQLDDVSTDHMKAKRVEISTVSR